MTTVSVIGLGYIGLPTAALFAASGIRTVGVDVKPHVVAEINAGRIHIVEPGLDTLVARCVAEGSLWATTVPEPADAHLIAVPTPFAAGNKPDVSYVEAAARMIAPVLARGNVVVLESTSPVGTTEQLAGWLQAARPDLAIADTANPDVDIAYCPERVLPGNILRELVSNDRVIGGLTPRCAERAAKLYAEVIDGECVLTDARSAELCKLAENSFRDVNIAFANELSLVCDELGVDVWNLIRLANRHPRVNILQPGPGVGGHCIAVDPWFIVDSCPAQAKLIRQAREVNDGKPHWVIDQVALALADRPAGERPIVVCLGLAFKPDIDDLRESPAVEICAALAARGDVRVLAVEPNIVALPAALAGKVELVEADAALAVADVAVILVDHAPFRALDPALFTRAAVVDTRGMLSPDRLIHRRSMRRPWPQRPPLAVVAR